MKNTNVLIIITLLMTMCSFLTVDIIPVNNGKGWDGGVFYEIIKSWSKGELGDGVEPYRFMRMGAFAPLVLMNKIFPNESLILLFSRLLAIGFAFGSLFLVFLAAHLTKSETKSGIKARDVVIVFVCSALVHAIYTMPALYPILTDHCALFLSGLAIFTARNIQDNLSKNIILFILSVYGIFVMPLVSIVPMVFLIFQSDDCKIGYFYQVRKHLVLNLHSYRYIVTIGLSLLFSCFFILLFHFNMKYVSDESLLSRGWTNLAPAIISLKEYSYIGLIFIIFTVCALISVFFVRAVPYFSLYGIILAFASLLIASIILFSIPNWSAGMGGPPLLVNLLTQALHSPLVSVASYFSYYGPIGVLGLITIFLVALAKIPLQNGDEPVFLATALLLLPTLIGNETRQFIALYPLLVYISIKYIRFSTSLSISMLCFSLLILSIGYPVSDNISKALARNADFLNPAWQAYFGRQGPWMSPDSILLWQSLLLLFLIFLILINFTQKDNRSTS
jgi:hypothetical protein